MLIFFIIVPNRKHNSLFSRNIVKSLYSFLGSAVVLQLNLNFNFIPFYNITKSVLQAI